MMLVINREHAIKHGLFVYQDFSTGYSTGKLSQNNYLFVATILKRIFKYHIGDQWNIIYYSNDSDSDSNDSDSNDSDSNDDAYMAVTTVVFE